MFTAIYFLTLLARQAPIAGAYVLQALTVAGLSVLALTGERPVLAFVLHLASSSIYGAMALAHRGHGGRGGDDRRDTP